MTIVHGASEASRPVLVGIDDSAAAAGALRFAAAEAALRGSSLTVIHVWREIKHWNLPLGWPDGVDPGSFLLRRLSERVADLKAERAEAGEEPVPISVEVVEGDPARELLATARGAGLLVLGAHDRHGASAVIGSVCHACAADPPCPVAIVPASYTQCSVRMQMSAVAGT